MKNLFGAFIAWADHRTGLHTALRAFFLEQVPASSGWRHVLGSVALFLILLQAFTGILLSLNYAPTPGEAYNSLRYILSEVTGGSLIRGLHHWGASAIVIVVVLHMVQVFLWGAYKRPRETTWLAGVGLLLLTLAYGLTGYLLPWDNRAYWGTVVVTQMAAGAPVAGPFVARLLGGGGPVGVVTFARFYALHVLLLPPATFLLIAFHIYLVRKHGIAPAPGDEQRPRKAFFPVQVFKDTAAIFAAFAILFTLAAAVRVPLEELADPSNTAYIPRPEWYFLFMFETLRLMTGPFETLVSVVLPGAAVLALVLVPFVDRGQVVAIARRTTAIAVVVLAAIGWTGLTVAAVLSKPPAEEAAKSAPSLPAADWKTMPPQELAGVAWFRGERCISCHSLSGGTTTLGPDLTRASAHRDAAWMIEHFRHPQAVRPGTAMPPIAIGDEGLNALSALLLKLDSSTAAVLRDAPDYAARGARVYEENHCSSCHIVNRAGMQVGPSLNGLAKRRDRDWIERHFADPAKLSPGTMMPPYRLSPADLDNLARYLLALPD